MEHKGPDGLDWVALNRLRRLFLERRAGRQDYWQNQSDLRSYDQTFAQRIGWKWDHVLAELRQRGWTPPRGSWLDWGCGSGIAGRALLDHFGAAATAELCLWDRSRLAMQYAAGRARKKYPALPVRLVSENAPALLLLSHVLTELNEDQIPALLRLIDRASAVIWIEPGTYEDSRALIALREKLRDRFNLVAPCPHQQACGLLEPANQPHWCHHFASPPPGLPADAQWVRFAHLLGIDLRSLPLSYLVLDRRPITPLPGDAVRMLGRPRCHKGYARLFGCRAAATGEARLNQRQNPEVFRRLRKADLPSLQRWRCEDGDIMDIQAWPWNQ
jgi:hypothetical protein